MGKLYKNKEGNYLEIRKDVSVMYFSNGEIKYFDYMCDTDSMIEITDFYDKVEIIGFPNSMGIE